MPWTIPTLADVFHARSRIAPYLKPTPQLEPESLSAVLGCHVILKCEHLNPTGAFKVRGGVNLLASMDPSERARGVLAVSTGNHAQSVAYAARLFRAPAVVYMPEAANPLKVAATKAMGAEVVLEGHDFHASRMAAEARAERDGLRYIHSANEPQLIAGVATAALELLEAVPNLDVILVPTGAGSGVLGAAIVARAVNPSIRVIGVQAEGAPALYESWKAGRPVTIDRTSTFAEGLAVRMPFELPLEWLPRLVDEIMLVSDAEIIAAIRLLIETARQVAEGAGAAALAALCQRRGQLTGKRIAVMLSGGNITANQLRAILNGTPETDSPDWVL